MISENLVLLILCFSLLVIYKKVNRWENSSETFSKNTTDSVVASQPTNNPGANPGANLGANLGSNVGAKENSIPEIITDTLKNIFMSPGVPQTKQTLSAPTKPVRTEAETNYTLLTNKFHNDYRDAITAFNSISEYKKVFNLDHDGVEQVVLTKAMSEPIVLQFILDVNESIIKNGSSLHRNSGWDECLPRKSVESGWDKVQKSLGLQHSLYDEPATASSFELLAILEGILFKTFDQSKYVITFVARKKNVRDRILIKLSVVYYNDRNKKLYKIYEDIDIVGFFVANNNESAFDAVNDQEQIGYDFKDLSQTDAIDNRFITFELQKKYKNRLREISNRISKMDSNVQDVYLS